MIHKRLPRCSQIVFLQERDSSMRSDKTHCNTSDGKSVWSQCGWTLELLVCNDQMHQSSPTPPPLDWFLRDETSHMSEANFLLPPPLNTLTNRSCSSHTKSCTCTWRSFYFFLMFLPVLPNSCATCFCVSEKPNYGHWVMSEQTILWDQHCLCQSYRKHKWQTDRQTEPSSLDFHYYWWILKLIVSGETSEFNERTFLTLLPQIWTVNISYFWVKHITALSQRQCWAGC